MPTDLVPNPSSSRFAAIRTRLARAYLEHKADLGVPVADDAEIVRRVDQITILLIRNAGMAQRTDNLCWLERYAWFTEVVDDLREERPGAPLDG